ncbi:Rpn family recombination-promoting nuclease/putative transposase [Candidatus Poribacteria bacterium]|nr:Rpn family recombination-promoting nuclease/putative transposase [Candidatus Poribacteria bacterium]
MVYLLPFRDKDNTRATSEVLVYILLEHQSTVDRTMGFRLLFYMCQIWDSQRREWRFQPIIPIIFYTGDQKWETFPSLETLMDLPEALNRFVPKFDALLLNVKREADETLLQSNHPFGWLLTVLKQETAGTEAFIAALLRLGNYLRGLPEAERSLWQQTIYYLHLLIFYRRPIVERPVLDQIVSENHPFLDTSEKEKQLMQSMAEHYLQQGETRAKREDILKLLQLRFHYVPEPLAEMIRSLDDRNWLEMLFEKAATTQTLEELRAEVDALTEDENHNEHSE